MARKRAVARAIARAILPDFAFERLLAIRSRGFHFRPAPAIAAAAAASVTSSKTPAFSLSMMPWTFFPDLPFEEQLAKVAKAGYTNVELVGEYRDWSAKDFARANAARKRHGILIDAVAGLDHGVANPDTRDAFLAELTQALVPMETLGCAAMIVLSGNAIPGLARDVQHQSCIETLKQAAASIDGKQIDGQPVRLLLESIDPEENPECFLTTAEEAIAVVRAVNHPQVQILYDLYHEQIAEGNLIVKLEKHIDAIGLIHVADVPGRHEPGTGEINYNNIYRKLVELNYHGIVAMEFKPTGDPVLALRAAKAVALSQV
jgi:hydroxypyruvate isomerase